MHNRSPSRTIECFNLFANLRLIVLIKEVLDKIKECICIFFLFYLSFFLFLAFLLFPLFLFLFPLLFPLFSFFLLLFFFFFWQARGPPRRGALGPGLFGL